MAATRFARRPPLAATSTSPRERPPSARARARCLHASACRRHNRQQSPRSTSYLRVAARRFHRASKCLRALATCARPSSNAAAAATWRAVGPSIAATRRSLAAQSARNFSLVCIFAATNAAAVAAARARRSHANDRSLIGLLGRDMAATAADDDDEQRARRFFVLFASRRRPRSSSVARCGGRIPTMRAAVAVALAARCRIFLGIVGRSPSARATSAVTCKRRFKLQAKLFFFFGCESPSVFLVAR